jgi:hypothetical protein
MAIDDIARAGGKVAKGAKAAKAAKATEEAAGVIVEFRGARYSFPPGTTKEQAERVLWNKVVRPTVKGDVEYVDLPSELTPERMEALRETSKGLTEEIATARKAGDKNKMQEAYDKNQMILNIISEKADQVSRKDWDEMVKASDDYYKKPKAEVLEFKPQPKKLDPGIYTDEDTGKYFKIDKDGNMEQLDEAP